MSGKRSNEQQQKPHASQDSEEDASSNSSNVPNTPKSKRPRTSLAPQPRVSSTAANPPAAAGASSPESESEEDSSSSGHHSLQSPPPKNKGKEENVVEEDVKKPPLFQRVFSEEDEIVILEGLFRFMKHDGGDVSGPVNKAGFHQSMKGSFPTEITKHQLSDKIKRLQKRFHRNKGRAFKPDSHESRIFELSNRIWGHKEMEKEKSISPQNHYCICRSGFVDSSFVCFAQDVLGVMSESRPTMKQKLIDLKVRECELRISTNLLENKKIEFLMDLLKSQAQ